MADTTETLKKLVATLEKKLQTKNSDKTKVKELLDRETASKHDLETEIAKYQKAAQDENRALRPGEEGFVAQHSKSVADHMKKINTIMPKLNKVVQEVAELEVQLKTAKEDLKMYETEKGKLDKKDKDYEKKKSSLQKKIKSKI